MRNEQLSNEENMLRGKNVTLRAVEPEDIDFIYQMENDPSVWHAGNTNVPFSRFQIEQYALTARYNIYADKQLRLMIDLKLPSQVKKTIGAIDLYDFDPIHKRAGVGILITKKEREKGFASESLALLIRYCFDVLMLHQIYCSISPDNSKSLGLFAKHGFVKCGLKKDWRLIRGEWRDEIMYQLINDHKDQKQ